MASPKDYVVYVLGGERSQPGGPARKSTGVDYYAGENESSSTLYTHAELTHIDRAKRESGKAWRFADVKLTASRF